MRIPWITGLMFLVLAAAPMARGENNTTETFAFADYYTNHPPLTVNQRLDQFSVQLIARLTGGSNVFDQTFNVAYTDPAVQSAIAQVVGALTNAGAASVSGPALVNTAVSLISTSSVTVERIEFREDITALQETLGPGTNLIGYLGICESYRITTNTQEPLILIGLTGGNPEPFEVRLGTTDLKTIILSVYDKYMTTTNTETYLTSQMYEFVGGGPVLSIEPVAPDKVRVFWPLPATGYVLEQTSALAAPPSAISWDQVALPYETNTTHISITVTPSGNRFYRLRWPP